VKVVFMNMPQIIIMEYETTVQDTFDNASSANLSFNITNIKQNGQNMHLADNMKTFSFIVDNKGKIIKTIKGIGNASNNIKMMMLTLPENEVVSGDKWQITQDIPLGSIPVPLTIECKYEGREEFTGSLCDKIFFTGNKENIKLNNQMINIDFTGYLYIDIEKGVQKHYSLKINMFMKMQQGALTKAAEIDMKIDLKN